MKIKKFIFVLIVLSLLLAACGGDGEKRAWCQTDMPASDGGYFYHVVDCTYRYTHVNRQMDCLVTIEPTFGEIKQMSCNP